MQILEERGTYYIQGRMGSFVAFLLARSKQKKVLVFYDTEDEAFLTEEEIGFYAGVPAHLFPAYTDRIFEKEDEAKRTAFLHHLLSDADFFGLFPYSAVNKSLPDAGSVSVNSKEILQGDTVYQEDIIQFLEKSGFENTPLVREVGNYSKRGSIIDVFTPSYNEPIRIEFFGDEVLSIRFFDFVSQRSLKEMEQCSITGISEPTGQAKCTIVDYLHPDITLVHRGISSLTGVLPADNGGLVAKKWIEICRSTINIDISGVASSEEGVTLRAVSNDDLRLLFSEQKGEIFKILSGKFREEWSHYRHVYVFAGTEHQGRRLQTIFSNYDINLPLLPAISFEADREWGIIIGPVRRGFRSDDVLVLTEDDIVGPKKRPVKKKWGIVDEFLNSFKDLAIGQWVVHVDHGIGIYKGMVPLKIGESTKDFILIEYDGGDRLYVPVDDLHLVQKFIGSEKFKPKIDKLGSSLWKNTKKRVKKQIEDIAGELLNIYAQRQVAEGYAYSAADELFREMESRFEFEETDGQLRAIEEVLGDLESTKPMDRLVCGDVGFGKTEVAVRASFKVVLDGKQVAVLVPTTVLAQQHYKTFFNRLSGYPVNIAVLSRFKSKEEQKKTIGLIKNGGVDIIIGTHRLLQKDITFRDLGLLVIDEEQRFGVKHKERLKTFKASIDILTLSATPIPRTLYMATMGIKDLSIIDSPPLDRLAVRTFVIQFNDGIIKKGVLDELRRGGQVFFVHNYVHNIGAVLDYLANLLPGVRIAVAHGQMEGQRLEKVMLDFIDRRFDVLLCTNIIESGLDISNVNTIFINNAHRMGLSDLYQLRGRVGRSEKQAYAYLVIPQKEQLSRDASLRLRILEEMTDLGSGFQIANYDLEIRGSGNLLGKEQSGTINLIGFELYCSMLEEAIQRLKKSAPEEETERFTTEINLPVDAFIPDSYVPDSGQRLVMYKKLSKGKNNEELKALREEFVDRFGIIPEQLDNLFDIVSLKHFLTNIKVRKIEGTEGQIVLHVTPQTPLDMKKVLDHVTGPHFPLKIMPDGRMVIRADQKDQSLIATIRNLLMQIIIL